MRTKEGQNQVVINVPPDIFEKLKYLKKQEGKSYAWVARVALITYINGLNLLISENNHGKDIGK